MPYRAFRHKKTLFAIVIIPAVSLLVVVGAAAVSRLDSASGDVNSLGGGAYGESVNVHTILGATVTSGPTPAVTLPPGGGGPFHDQLAGVTVPNLLSAGLLEVSTQGTSGPSGSVTSLADVANLDLLAGLLKVDLVKSTCSASASGASASSTLTHVTAAGITIPADPAPNTTVGVPLVGLLILNEQIRSTANGNTDVTVNALHLKLTSSVLGTGDLILAQSRCQISAPSVVVPVGAVGGIGLAAVLGAVFFWKVVRRRPDHPGSSVMA